MRANEIEFNDGRKSLSITVRDGVLVWIGVDLQDVKVISGCIEFGDAVGLRDFIERVGDD